MSDELATEHLREDDGTHVLVVSGTLDSPRAPQLKASIDELIDAGARHLVLDLSSVGFIDSSGLVALVTTATRLRKAAGDLRIAAPSPQVERLLGLTRMDAVFGVFPTRAQALGAER